jgi:hypothetical protein
MTEINLLPSVKNRVKDCLYLYRDNIVFWDGKRLKCEHKRVKNRCKECGGSSICEHNREKSKCKECGGGSICEHNRVRSSCKECGGGSICEHNRVRSSCKECGGSQICEHNRKRSHCKECGGSQICEHDRIRSVCKECGGGSICEHNRQKNKCKECGGSQICEHNREMSKCKECRGSQICEHNREMSKCKECRGNSICEHNREMSKCKECRGNSICEHDRIRSVCKECRGGSICEHNKRRSSCSTCSTNRKNFCQICQSVDIRHSPYSPLCFRCHCLSHPEEPIPRRYKLKQHYIYDKIKGVYSDFEYDKTISGGCSNKRPDFLFDKLTHSVIVEIDEDQHNKYDSSCDKVRTMSMFTDLGNRPLVMIRFNPDEYNKNRCCFSFDEKNNIIVNEDEFKNRIEMLLDNIQFRLDNIPNKELTEIKLFFNE